MIHHIDDNRKSIGKERKRFIVNKVLTINYLYIKLTIYNFDPLRRRNHNGTEKFSRGSNEKSSR